MRPPVLLLSLFLLSGLAASPASADDLDDAFQRLKEAQTKNDVAAVKKGAAEVHELASKAIASPAPADPEAKEGWAIHIDQAKSADLFSEYALMAAALQAEPGVQVDLISALEQQNPKSKYLDEVYGTYLVALSKSGATAKIPAIAEKGLANLPENEDLLIYLLDNAATRNQNDRAVGYANRIITVLNKHSKPANIPAADWDRKKTLALGRSYLLVGASQSERRQYGLADKNLRAALPLVKGNPAMLAPALFHLGLSNYQLGLATLSKARVLEGAAFSEQCAAIESPYADQARRNAYLMKQGAAKMR